MAKSQAFTTNYNVGGDIDRVKNLKNVDNIVNLKTVGEVEKVNSVGIVDEVKNVDNVDTVGDVNNLETVQEVKVITEVKEVGKIKGLASLTQPYNMMEMFDIPAQYKDPLTGNDYEFEIILPDEDVEILAISMTCSGYGEGDHYDLFFNDVQWFKDWYCSEVKEGLFLGTSTYVYAAPPNSKIKLIFKNDSGSEKKIWLGIRMLRK